MVTNDVGTQRRSRIIPIQHRPSDEDRKIFLLTPKPITRVTGSRIFPISRYDLDDSTEHYQTRVLIICKVGVVEWTPIIFYCHPHWNSISGLNRLPDYAAEPLRRALLGAVRDFICNEHSA